MSLVRKITHTILPGTHEYVDEIFLENLRPETTANNTIEIYYDNTFAIEDMVIDISMSHDESETIQVDLVYPASGAVLPLIPQTIVTTSWCLNSTSKNADLWYRVPAGSKLKITTSLASVYYEEIHDMTIKICVIGKA